MHFYVSKIFSKKINFKIGIGLVNYQMDSVSRGTEDFWRISKYFNNDE